MILDTILDTIGFVLFAFRFLALAAVGILAILVPMFVLAAVISTGDALLALNPMLYLAALYEIYFLCGYNARWFASYGPPVVTVILLLVAFPPKGE